MNGKVFDVAINGNQAVVNGKTYTFEVGSEEKKEEVKTEALPSAKTITAPMLGTVVKLNVNVGDVVKKGQDLVVLEVMKMENPIKSPSDAKIKEILVSKGNQVNAGQKLIVLE